MEKTNQASPTVANPCFTVIDLGRGTKRRVV